MPFTHLTSDGFDVLMLNDYSFLPNSFGIHEIARKYEYTVLVCWSIGVWAGQKLFSGKENVFAAINWQALSSAISTIAISMPSRLVPDITPIK